MSDSIIISGEIIVLYHLNLTVTTIDLNSCNQACVFLLLIIMMITLILVLLCVLIFLYLNQTLFDSISAVNYFSSYFIHRVGMSILFDASRQFLASKELLWIHSLKLILSILQPNFAFFV
jgi:hypothetical protein